MYTAQISPFNEEVLNSNPGFLKRIVWVLTSPGKLMEILAEKPRVLFGLILAALSFDVLYIARLALYKDFLRSTMFATAEFTESLTGQKLTAEMIEQTLPTSVIQGFITTPISMVMSMLFVTVIFFSIFKIMGGQGRFKAYLSVTGYAYVISALYLLLLIPISFVTGSLHLNAPVTSLATLVSSDIEGTFLYGILKGIDVFQIWYYAVLAIGYTVVSKLKKTNVYIVVAGIFLIGLTISGAGAAALKGLL